MTWTVSDYVRLLSAIGVLAVGIIAAYNGEWDIATGILLGAYGGMQLPTTKVVQAVDKNASA